MKLRSLGDTVLMTAPLAELRRAYPEAEIHAAVTSRWASVLERHPAVDRVWPYERHEEAAARAKATARLALRLRKEKFDCVVNFHASPSSAMAAFATRAKIRAIHFHGHTEKNRYSTVTIPGKGTLKPIIERDMDAVRALGLHVPAGRMPEIFLQPGERAQGEEQLRRMGLGGPILALGLGASRPTKSWPIDRFAALAAAWSERMGGGVIALAGPGEEWLIQGFLKAVDDAVSAVPDASRRPALRARIAADGKASVRQLAGILSNASAFMGNDSGPKHVAVAVRTPTVTLFGPEHPFEWHPYPMDAHPYFFIENLACRKDAMAGMPPWCGMHTCIDEQHQCMRKIGVDAVFEQCRKVARAEAVVNA